MCEAMTWYSPLIESRIKKQKNMIISAHTGNGFENQSASLHDTSLDTRTKLWKDWALIQ